MTTWVVLRAAGIGAYVALFLSVAWGLLGTTSLVTKRVSKPAANTFHGVVAAAGFALLLVHIAGLLVDRFVPFGIWDVTIPLRSTFRPVAVAAGILAMYGMALVLASSWARKRVGTTWWRRLHQLSVPVFALALLHGVFAGSDTERPWLYWLYATTGVATLFLVIVRGLTAGYRPTRPARPEPARAVPGPVTPEAG
jgi:DMSO/TMAO reductase YedYZ heme-binding membrane subunit